MSAAPNLTCSTLEISGRVATFTMNRPDALNALSLDLKADFKALVDFVEGNEAIGALVLAAFFIATDPVSGCSTMKGRLVFGAGVAILTLAIRRFGGYPDGVAFAVLLMNMAVPLIDRLTRPRTYGH